jgi:hypothetical protein
MNRIHHIGRLVRILTGLAIALVAAVAAAPAALATLPPLPGPVSRYGPVAPPGSNKHPPLPTHVHTLVVGGMPGWQIALIAVGAAVLAAAVAVLLDRARAARRHPAAVPA